MRMRACMCDSHSVVNTNNLFIAPNLVKHFKMHYT